MRISRSIEDQLKNASWIRRMFEEGARLKKERGAENVYDFTLGNPDVEPPAEVLDALRRVVSSARPGSHGYMPNPGYPHVRERIAELLRRETGVDFVADDVFMTVGSSGACNVILKSILDPGDEVIVLMPCFSEYPFYVTNHAGRMVTVETGADFLPDIDAIRAAITPRTRAIFLNTPNNPTGRVYPESTLRDLAAMLDTLESRRSSSATNPTSASSSTAARSPRSRRSSATAPCATLGRSRKASPASASVTSRSRHT